MNNSQGTQPTVRSEDSLRARQRALGEITRLHWENSEAIQSIQCEQGVEIKTPLRHSPVEGDGHAFPLLTDK